MEIKAGNCMRGYDVTTSDTWWYVQAFWWENQGSLGGVSSGTLGPVRLPIAVRERVGPTGGRMVIEKMALSSVSPEDRDILSKT